jgi:hypothetical protein
MKNEVLTAVVMKFCLLGYNFQRIAWRYIPEDMALQNNITLKIRSVVAAAIVINLVIPLSIDLTVKMVVAQLVKKFPIFCEIRRFIAVQASHFVFPEPHS